MPFCNSCLEEIASRLKEDDVIVLHSLEQTGKMRGISYKDIKQSLEEEGIEISRHNIYQSLQRLAFVGLSESYRSGRTECFYITPAGEKVMRLFKE